MTGSTKPSGLLFVVGLGIVLLANSGQTIKAILLSVFAVVAIVVDAYRVAKHEDEHGCGS